MANEVIIEEYAAFDETMQCPTQPITTQVLDIAEASAALNALTRYVVVSSKGTGFWYKFGDSSVSAIANTDGNIWLQADGRRPHKVGAGTYIDSAADV